MERAAQVTRRVTKAGKRRAEIDGGSAPLAVEAPHREVERPPVRGATDRERPARPDTRDVEVILAVLAQAAEVERLHTIAGIRIVDRGTCGGREHRAAVAGVPDREPRRRRRGGELRV